MASKKASWWRDAAVVGLIAVVLGAAISATVALLVADRTTDASAHQLRDQIAADREQLELSIAAERDRQAAQIEADRDDRDRTRLASVYAKFTETSNAFAFVAIAQRKCIADNLIYEGENPDLPTGFELTKACSRTFSEYKTDRYELQGAVNDVHIYGSEAATGAMRAVLRSLPPTLPSVDGSDTIDLENIDEPAVDVNAFSARYSDFLDVMCVELSFTPDDQACE